MGVKAATRALLPVVCLVLSALPLSAQGATPAVARIEALLPGFAEELALLQSDAELRDSVDWERAVAALATWLGPVPEARMLAAFRTVLQADVGRAIRGSAGFRLVADGRDTEWSGSPFVSRDTRGDGWATRGGQDVTTARAAWDGKGVLSLMLCTAERPGPGQALQFLIDCVGSADWDLNVFFLVDDSGGARGFSSVRREGRTWIYSVAPPGPGSYKIHCSFSTDGGKSYSWGTTQVFDCRIGAPVFPAEGSVTAPYPWFDQAFFDLGISFATPNRGWVRVAEGPAEILEVVMPPELTPGVSFFTPDGAQVHDEQASVTKRGDRWIVTVSPKSPGEYRLSLFAVREGRWSWLCMLRVDY